MKQNICVYTVTVLIYTSRTYKLFIIIVIIIITNEKALVYIDAQPVRHKRTNKSEHQRVREIERERWNKIYPYTYYYNMLYITTTYKLAYVEVTLPHKFIILLCLGRS